jgi:3-oxoacyl-[acyl-carrier protein] reductase
MRWIMNLMEGKNAVITGAARGIGRAIAEAFYYQGANVLLTDIDEETGRKAVSEINCGRANKILFRKMNITDPKEVAESIEFAAEQFGQVDTLVNNAAILIAHEVVDFPLDEWQKVFRVNMEGTFICSQAAVRYMIRNHVKGSILNIASASSRKADAKHAAYSASKAAIVEFARVLALEVGKYEIRVNSILPGATETDMLAGVFKEVEGLREDIIGKTLLRKLGKPEDHANAAVFLCSDMASHITGEYLVVSGGEFLNP